MRFVSMPFVVLAVLLVASYGVLLAARRTATFRQSTPLLRAWRGGGDATQYSAPDPDEPVPWKTYRLSGHKDCKGWSIGIGTATAPLALATNFTRVLGPEAVPGLMDGTTPTAVRTSTADKVEAAPIKPPAGAHGAGKTRPRQGASLSRPVTSRAHRRAEEALRGALGTPWRLVADPFVLLDEGGAGWTMFAEVMGAEGRGRIGWATQATGAERQPWRWQGVISGLPHGAHASYPYVVRDPATGVAYMLPQVTGQVLTVYASRGGDYPATWSPTCVVDPDESPRGSYHDSNLLLHNDNWYVFASHYDKHTMRVMRQVIFVSTSGKPTGPYRRHPGPHPPSRWRVEYGRNAGRMLSLPDGRVVRFTQHYKTGEVKYGEGVRAAVLPHLSPDRAGDEEYDVSWVSSLPADVLPGYDHNTERDLWRAAGAHHVDFQPLPPPARGYMVVADGREPCEVTRARPHFRRWQWLQEHVSTALLPGIDEEEAAALETQRLLKSMESTVRSLRLLQTFG